MGKAGKRRGKYLKETPKKRKGKSATIVCVSALVVLFVAVAVILWPIQDRSIYETIVHNGYTGTQEQWLASLVGEEVDSGDAETAYELAVTYGYKGTEAEWVETLIGAPITHIDGSPYMIACENGFEGSLMEWLTELSDEPERLGKSNDEGQKTEYELACEYGYSGTFIEWIVSVANDRVFE